MNCLPIQLSGFYYWWFDHYGDTDTCLRYDRRNYNEEYGISSNTFLYEETDDAIQDAKDYFERNPKELEPMFKIWKDSLKEDKCRIIGLLEDIRTFEISLTETLE